MSSKKEHGKGEIGSPKRGKGFEEIACNVCNLPHRTEDCPLICAGVQVQDAELPSKALLTLPDTLTYKKLTDNTYEIISKYGFSKGTQFGPLDAPKTTLFNPRCSYVLKLFSGREYFCYLDISDEANCNWMCLVPFNSDPAIKNCICYQLRDKIYFSVVNDIFPCQSLIVSYSPGYAAQLEASNKSNDDKQLGESSPLSNNNTQNPMDKDAAQSSSSSEDHNYMATSSEFSSPEADPCTLWHSERRKTKLTEVVQFESEKEKIDKNILGANVSVIETNVSAESSVDLPVLSTHELSNSEDNSQQRVRYSDKLNKRLGAVLAVDSWRCKFCREEIATIPDFAAHLIQHYKLVGAARTEKSRLDQKVKIEAEIHVKEEPLENASGSAEVKNNIRPSFPYYCDICVNHKPFNRAEYVIRHLRKHTGEFYCNFCDQMFTGKELLGSHLCSVNAELEDSNSKVKCTLCDKVFSSQRAVKNHLKLKHGKVYSCSKCQKSFTKAIGLRKHICKRKTPLLADSDVSILHKCEMCETTFMRAKDLSKHLRIHKGLFNCNFCGKSLSNDSYKIHLSICEKLFSFLQNTDEILKCPQSNCTSVCQDLDSFRHHMTGHTHPFMCPRCNLRLRLNSDIKDHECAEFSCDADGCSSIFDSLNGLKKHIYESHQEINSYCFECAIPFATLNGYENHKSCCEESLTDEISKRPELPKKRASTAGSFVCETCGATYTKWNSLKTHRYTHGPKRFICDVCGKGFHRRELLEDHKFVHQDAQFQCDLCGKKMKSKKSLDVHSRIHSGDKRFHCEECGKSFAQKVNLLTHQYVHLKSQGFEGFQCPYCEKRFSSKEYLSFHIEGHEKGKTQQCDVCGKSFVKAHMLRQHKKLTHSGVRFSCEFCDIVVRLNYSLMRHMKNRHLELQEIWGKPGYSLERMFQCGSGFDDIFKNGYLPTNNEDEDPLGTETEKTLTGDDVNEIETEEIVSQDCDSISVVIPQSNMVFLRMDQEGEIVLRVTEEGQTMIEVEAEVIDDDQ